MAVVIAVYPLAVAVYRHQIHIEQRYGAVGIKFARWNVVFCIYGTAVGIIAG